MLREDGAVATNFMRAVCADAPWERAEAGREAVRELMREATAEVRELYCDWMLKMSMLGEGTVAVSCEDAARYA
jgi:hypothetical protein